jgi:hypothetical protein
MMVRYLDAFAALSGVPTAHMPQPGPSPIEMPTTPVEQPQPAVLPDPAPPPVENPVGPDVPGGLPGAPEIPDIPPES